MISEITKRILIASKVKGVGKRTLHELAKEKLIFELPVDRWHLDIPELKDLVPGSSAHAKALLASERDIEMSERLGGGILSFRDAFYPKLLRGLKDSPALLYYRGNIGSLTDRAVAIVGTREPSRHGVITASRITKYFASRGWQIVSGLAIGLDTVAHEEALKEKAYTVAVMAHGLDSVYPQQNKELAERIQESGGLLISEYPYGTPGYTGNFVERDRIQAALCRGVVMVQSGKLGGSWHASRASLSYNRWLFVPKPTDQDIISRHPKSFGNLTISSGTVSDKLKILKCEVSDLERLFVFNSKEDYFYAEERMQEVHINR